MTSQLILALIRKLRVSSMYLAYFLTCYTRCLYNQALPDVRSTGAGINYLFCMWYSRYGVHQSIGGSATLRHRTFYILEIINMKNRLENRSENN